MLGNAVKRCHATPQLMRVPTMYSQIMPDISLMNANTATMLELAGSSVARFMVKKSVHGFAWP